MSSVWSETPQTLTSFTPLSSEVQTSGNFLKRWWKKGKDDSDQSSEGGGSEKSSREVSVERNLSREQSLERSTSVKSLQQIENEEKEVSVKVKARNGDQSESDSSTNTDAHRRVREGSTEPKRTLNSVLTRLSNILDRRSTTPQLYKDSDFKQFWMPDRSCRECYDCGDKFTTFRRRHHCRICGQIFCNACCNQELSGKIIGYKGSIRVCTYCCTVVSKFAQKSDPLGDLKLTKEDLRKVSIDADTGTTGEGGARGLRKATLELSGQGGRSPGDAEGDDSAPFDLTPQSEFVNLDNFKLERKLLIQDSVQLLELWSLMMDTEEGIEIQSYRIRLRTYQKCILGNKLVDWLLKRDKAANRIQAIAIGQALIDADYIVPVGGSTVPFRDDFTLYKPAELSFEAPPLGDLQQTGAKSEDSAPQWFQEIKSTHDDNISVSELDVVRSNCTELNICDEHFLKSQEIQQDTSAGVSLDTSDEKLPTESLPPAVPTDAAEHLEEPLPRQNLIGPAPEDSINSSMLPKAVHTSPEITTADSSPWRTLDSLSDDNGEKLAYTRLQHAHQEHLTVLTKQLLTEEGLSPGWADIVISTVDRVTLFVKPDVKNGDEMDIRNYVHVKKIPGGKREQTALVHGVVFTKNIAHKKMSQHINNPRVLLLKGSIEYQRVENKLSSLQPQILQEEEFLRKNIAKIASLKPKPDVVVVEKSVSRLAQDFMLKHGITLIYNVKLSVMDRLSRFTLADIAPSIDSLVSGPRLGFCHTFLVRTFYFQSGDSKTILTFDGCATHLGCAITLRGASTAELKRVKKIMNFMIYASYHSRLEISFGMEEFLLPPAIGDDSPLDLDLESSVDMRDGKSTMDGVSREEIPFLFEKELAKENLKKSSGSSRNESEKCNVKETDEKADQSHGDLEVADGNSIDGANCVQRDVCAIENTRQGTSLSAVENEDVDRRNPNVDKVCVSQSHDASLQKEPIKLVESSTKNEELHVHSDKDLFEETGVCAIENETCDKQNLEDHMAADEVDVADSRITGPNTTENEIEDSEIINNSSIKHFCDNETNLVKEEEVTFTVAESSVLMDQSEKMPNIQSDQSNAVSGKTDQPDSKVPEKTLNQVLIEITDISGDICDHGSQVDSNKRNLSPKPSEKHLVKRNSSGLKGITDFSDPLQNYQKNQDESIFQSNLAMEEQRLKIHRKFKSVLDNVTLSTSPYIHYDLPYLVTEEGMKCELRRYFPDEVYWSHHFSDKGMPKGRTKFMEIEPPKKPIFQSNIRIKEAHPLIWDKLNKSVNDKNVQGLLAEFRAYGGRIEVIRKNLPSLKKMGRPNLLHWELWRIDPMERGNNSQLVQRGTIVLMLVLCGKERHQRIAVLFSSYSYVSANHPSPCVYPWVVTMDFYGRNDITLGGFLDRFCFREAYVCPSESCDTPMVEHIRRFAHGQGCIYIMLRKLENPIGFEENNVLIWSWCRKCKQVTPIVKMSTDTWNMSFAKYLELRFHGNMFTRRASGEPCQHSLHHDHYQYFGFRDIVASFKYSTIKLKEIALPPFVISRLSEVDSVNLYRLRDEAKKLTNKGTDLFSRLVQALVQLKAEVPCEAICVAVNRYQSDIKTEKTELREVAHKVRGNLTVLLNSGDVGNGKEHQEVPDANVFVTEVEDGLTLLKRIIAEAVVNWNVTLQELYNQQKKIKQAMGNSSKKEKEVVSTGSSLTSEPDDIKSLGSSPGKEEGVSSFQEPGLTSGDGVGSGVRSDSSTQVKSQDSTQGMDITRNQIRSVASDTSLVDSYTYGITPVPKIDFESSAENVSRSDVEEVTILGGTEETTETGVTMTTEPAEQELLEVLSLETEKEEDLDLNTYDTDVLSLTRNILMPEETSDKESMKGSPVHSVSKFGEKMDNTDSSKKTEEPQHSDHAAMKKPVVTINSMWQGPGPSLLQMPFDACEHYLLPSCQTVPVVVYDHEPSSIIAYTLSCHDYHSKLQDLQIFFTASMKEQRKSDTEGIGREDDMADAHSTVKKPGKLSFFRGTSRETSSTKKELVDSVRYFPKKDLESIDSPPDEVDGFPFFSSITASHDIEKSKTGKQPTSSHIEIQFADSTSRFYCKVYFAEQFRQLRKLVFPQGEDVFIRSLSRCKIWEAKGGKSGSVFCKTDDDRFILKQMSAMEIDSFENFGPKYFQYISKMYIDQKPSALAKLVGVFRIGFRNSQTNNAIKQDLLVMENLFYNRKISQTFDLKGSERNRLVKTSKSQEKEIVLMDENFLKASVDAPLYVRPHSKTALTLAISHDSQFLASNLVMDYSLLVGLDEHKKELVVGIIDYIRTFTWDKKLETVIKSTVSGKLPTVVSPELYRNRFIDQMGKYFLPVPDQWSGLGRDVDN